MGLGFFMRGYVSATSVYKRRKPPPDNGEGSGRETT